MSTSLGIDFEVNDLDVTYEIVGTSENYSFQQNLGIGRDLVDQEGDSVSKIVSLQGEYGVFDIRVFAVSNIGVRSPSLTGVVEVNPPEFEGTFTFNNIQVDSLDRLNLSTETVLSPVNPGDELIVESEFFGKNLRFSWDLIPPNGHSRQGQSVSSELLSDLFFSGFRVNIKDQGQSVNLSSLDENNEALIALSESLSTAPGSVVDLLDNYKDFNLTLNEEVFDALNLSREVTVEIVCVDKFGEQSKGSLIAKNHIPFIDNLTHNIVGSEAFFSWFVDDADFLNVEVEYLGIPSTENIKYQNDLQSSIQYYKDISEAASYNEVFMSSYDIGDKVVYKKKVYECIVAHSRQSYDNPILNSANWKKIGDKIPFVNGKTDVVDGIYSNVQSWGYDYYYTFKPSDFFGDADVYNLTKNGLISKNSSSNNLLALNSRIQINGLRFRENEDDFVFNWDVVDQDGNGVDLNKYRFAVSNSDTPLVLGISGSLFDAGTNIFLSGITKGHDSKSVSVGDNNLTIRSENLPSAKIFDTFEYTREMNNSIYGTGGFVSDYQNYDKSSIYNANEIVLYENGKLYKSKIDSNDRTPVYEKWEPKKTYQVNEVVEYNKNIYKVAQEFGPDKNSDSNKGFYNETYKYSVGDIIVAPSRFIRIFDENSEYYFSDVVMYLGNLYRCIEDIPEDLVKTPGQDGEYWKIVSLFDEVSCFIFELINDSAVGQPSSDRVSWKVLNPANDASSFELIVPRYQLDVSNWSSVNNYASGDIVVYNNDIWSGTQAGTSQAPIEGSDYWTNTSDGGDIGLFSDYYGRNYQAGDLVYSNNSIYKCTKNDPRSGPILAISSSPESINSSYDLSDWLPIWEKNTDYDNFIFDHVGIPESGKRSVGLEVGIVSAKGEIFSKQRIVANNPAPSILAASDELIFPVDSLSESTKVKFRFNYTDQGLREKTTKVNLYRSETADFSIFNEKGLPFESSSEPGSTLVKTALGAAEAVLGDNINEIIDTPPLNIRNTIYWEEQDDLPDGVNAGDVRYPRVEQQTGYFYKILPFDDFGSGYLYEIQEKVAVFPSNYSDKSENGFPGPVVKYTEDAVPDGVLNFTGSTAFTTYFLSWSMPNSQFDVNTNNIIEIAPNDLSHYEVWSGTYQYLKDENQQDWPKIENSGYRRFDGDLSSTFSAGEDIPGDAIDPGFSITNAKSVFNTPASSPSIETSHPGIKDEIGYFWVRAVDKAGNKSSFVGNSNSDSDYVEGLKLELGSINLTDIGGFEQSITSQFRNTPAIVSERGNNPFEIIDGELQWIAHTIWLNGASYSIDSGSENDFNKKYVYWSPSTSANSYQTSTENPDGQSGEGFIVATFTQTSVSTSYHAFANALIGTAQISDAAITDAKIQNLTADKITAGQGIVADLKILNPGKIRSAGFDEDSSSQGFLLKNDGGFIFRGAGGSELSMENNTLLLRGLFRQSDNKDYDFIDIDVSPPYFNYVENEDSTFEPRDLGASSKIDVNFRNSSVASLSDVQIKITKIDASATTPESIVQDWGDADAEVDGVKVFEDYNPTIDGQKISLVVSIDTFDSLVQDTHDSVVFYFRNKNSTIEKSASIVRLVDGAVGESAIITDLSNENHSIPADKDGNTSSSAFAEATTRFSVFKGGQDVTSSYSIETTLANVSITGANSRDVAVIAMSADQGSVEFTASSSDPGYPDVSAIFSLTKVRAGDDGQNALVYRVNSSADAIKADPDNQTHTPSIITFTASKHEGNTITSPFTGATLKLYRNNSTTAISPDNQNGQLSYTITSNTASLKIEMLVGETVVDSETIPVVLDGDPGDTKGVVAIFSDDNSGSNQSFTPGSYEYVNYYEYTNTKPSLPVGGLTWVKYVGDKGGPGDPGPDGAVGTYRGVYDNSGNTNYVAKTETVTIGGINVERFVRGDIVRDGTKDKYFICKEDNNGIIPGTTDTISLENTTYWKSFGLYFESIATDILLTKDANITQQLIIGDGSTSGAIVSNGFVDDDDYTPAGFKIESDFSSASFNIGAKKSYTYDNSSYDTKSYLKFDTSSGGRIEFQGSLQNNSVAANINWTENVLGQLPQANFIGGGYDNTNNSELASSIVGGALNTGDARFSLIGGGYNNICKDDFSSIVAGYDNSMPKAGDSAGANIIGAGQENEINGGTNQSILGGYHNVIEYNLSATPSQVWPLDGNSDTEVRNGLSLEIRAGDSGSFYSRRVGQKKSASDSSFYFPTIDSSKKIDYSWFPGNIFNGTNIAGGWLDEFTVRGDSSGVYKRQLRGDVSAGAHVNNADFGNFFIMFPPMNIYKNPSEGEDLPSAVVVFGSNIYYLLYSNRVYDGFFIDPDDSDGKSSNQCVWFSAKGNSGLIFQKQGDNNNYYLMSKSSNTVYKATISVSKAFDDSDGISWSAGVLS